MDRERFEKQLNFILEIDKEKQILRQTHIRGYSRQEDDAEHAWHMAVMAFLLQEYSNEKIDIGRTMLMLLIHDLVEIYAGDTFAYDAAGAATQRTHETSGADRLFSKLPEDQAKTMRALWEEFEAWETPEAKFARSLDRFQPMMLNAATDGRAWSEHGVKVSQVMKRNARTHEGSEALWAWQLEHFIKPNAAKGRLKQD